MMTPSGYDTMHTTSSHWATPRPKPSGSEPPETWVDRETLWGALPYGHGRGADDIMTNDDPTPTRSHPASMNFSAPLHTPYGTAEATDIDFWGPNPDLLAERRPLLPDYALSEHSWDSRNPHECGLRNALDMPDVYADSNDISKGRESVSWADGATLARTVDVKEMSENRYFHVTQTTNPTAYAADPIIGNGAGGMGPTLGNYLGKKGTPKPSGVPDYIPPAGGAMTSAGPLMPQYRLPGATRSNRTHSIQPGVTGGFVANYGNETVNPQIGQRLKKHVDFESRGGITGGYIASGADTTFGGPNGKEQMNDMLAGARFRLGNGNFETMGNARFGVSAGTDLSRVPQVGGRPGKRINFDTTGLGGPSSGVGSDLSQVPQVGGRPGHRLNFTNTVGIAGGHSVSADLSQVPQVGGRPGRRLNFTNTMGIAGGHSVGADLSQVPQVGGRPGKRLNFDTTKNGGALSGMGADLSQVPQVGGRASRFINFETMTNGGASSGVNGIECNDILGGTHYTHSEGVVGYVAPAGAMNQDYGGLDVAYGITVDSRPRYAKEVTSVMLPGVSGRGTPVAPEFFITLPNTQMNANGVYDDTPDPTLQIAARSTLGAQALLNFSRENLDELSIHRTC